MIIGRINGYSCTREGGVWIRKFHILSDKIYHCKTRLFLPLMNSDVIVLNTHGTGEDLIIDKWPFVKPMPEEDLVNSYMIPALNKDYNMVNVMHEYLKIKCTSDNIIDYIEDIATSMESITIDEEAFNEASNDSTMTLSKEIFYNSLYGMLKWFRKNLSVRRFKLLGLNIFEIKELIGFHKLSPYVLYNAVLENPYMLYPLGSDVCERVAKILCFNLTDDDKIKGRAVCSMFKYIQLGWTCVDEVLLPIITSNRDYFQRTYDLKWLGNYVYFPITYNVEGFIAKWFKEANVTIIVGEAGTGKTTRIARFIEELMNSKSEFHVCSFTGKAVQRVMTVVKNKIPDVSDDRFSTIHRLVASKTKTLDTIIIDEISMVSMPLFHSLISKYRNVKMFLVGDPHQLMPIEWGHMLEPLIASHTMQITRLEVNYRQDDKLLVNLRNVLAGNSICTNETLSLIPVEGEAIYTEVCNIMNFIQPSGDKVMVLTPYSMMLSRLNDEIRKVLRQDSHPYVIDRWKNTFYLNDRVMLTKNIKSDNLFNGDEGLIVDIKASSIIIEWERTQTRSVFETQPKKDDEDDPFEFDEGTRVTKHIQVAYAITCHKSQGSEWDGIILVIPAHKANYNFLTRRLIYTALTRARKYCYIVGDVGAVQRAIKNPNKCSSTLLPYRIDNL